MDFYSDIDLLRGVLRNARLDPKSEPPENAQLGQCYYNSEDCQFYMFNEDRWEPVSGYSILQDSETIFNDTINEQDLQPVYGPSQDETAEGEIIGYFKDNICRVNNLDVNSISTLYVDVDNSSFELDRHIQKSTSYSFYWYGASPTYEGTYNDLEAIDFSQYPILIENLSGYLRIYFENNTSHAVEIFKSVATASRITSSFESAVKHVSPIYTPGDVYTSSGTIEGTIPIDAPTSQKLSSTEYYRPNYYGNYEDYLFNTNGSVIIYFDDVRYDVLMDKDGETYFYGYNPISKIDETSEYPFSIYYSSYLGNWYIACKDTESEHTYAVCVPSYWGSIVPDGVLKSAIHSSIRLKNLVDGPRFGIRFTDALYSVNTPLDPGQYACSLGYHTSAIGEAAHSEGSSTAANVRGSHAEGVQSTAGERLEGDSIACHAEGYNTYSSGTGTHSEGYETRSTGTGSHSEGDQTRATTNCAHAEGESTEASGIAAHSDGSHTIASGNHAYAGGFYTIAQKMDQHVFGRYNIADTAATGSTYVEIVGKGTDDTHRSNARTLDWSGNEVLAGKLTVGAEPTGDSDVLTKRSIFNLIKMKMGVVFTISSIPAGQESTQSKTLTIDPNYYPIGIVGIDTRPNATNSDLLISSYNISSTARGSVGVTLTLYNRGSSDSGSLNVTLDILEVYWAPTQS